MNRRVVAVLAALVVASGVGFLIWVRAAPDTSDRSVAPAQSALDAERDLAADREANERLLRAMKESVDQTPDPVEPDPGDLPSIEEVLGDGGG